MKRIDNWRFTPHYPYPPSGRRWALGVQNSRAYAALLVHTTHASCEVKGSREQLVLSNSAERPAYRMVYWYNNPFHLLTGYGEANLSNGKPSQPNKRNGIENLLWLLTSASPSLARRDGLATPSKVDAMFDRGLPAMVDEIRTRLRGADVAKAMHQEVVSVDGISHPVEKVGLAEEGAAGFDDDEKKQKGTNDDDDDHDGNNAATTQPTTEASASTGAGGGGGGADASPGGAGTSF